MNDTTDNLKDHVDAPSPAASGRAPSPAASGRAPSPAASGRAASRRHAPGGVPPPADHMHDHMHDHPHDHPHDHDHGEATGSGVSRRSFLAASGFSLAALLLPGCERPPVQKAVPYLAQPEGRTPGVADWYASVCEGCSAGCGTLVKVRDGRPIKVEGLPDHPHSRGGLCAIGQALPIGLYDSLRPTAPRIGSAASTWTEVDARIMRDLDAIRARGGRVVMLTGVVTSPTQQRMIDGFLATFTGARHIVLESRSHSALLDAHEELAGVRALPRLHLDRADVIASFEADFLGTWISPVAFTKRHAAARTPDATPPRMSHHVQIESTLSITGGRADERLCLRPDEVRAALVALHARIAARAGRSIAAPDTLAATTRRVVDRIAARLWSARGSSLVLCGRNDREMQRTACAINILLGNIGTTVDLAHPSHETAARDDDRAWLLARLRDRTIDALFIHNTNPVHTLAGADDIRARLRALPLVVSLSQDADESATAAHIHCPDHHPLEHWSDAEAVHGVYGVAQPMIRPLGTTRSMLVSLATWSGAPADERTLVRETCRTRVHARTAGAGDFDRFWDALVARGFIAYDAAPVAAARPTLDAAVWRPVAPAPPPAADVLDLVLIDTVAMREPRHAHNPWLHELPDPVTKITWENVALLAPATAARLGLRDGDVVRLRRAGGAVPVEAPVLALPGMAAQVVALALGYGRAGTDRFADVGPRWLEARPTVERGATVGSNAAPLAPLQEGHVAYVGSVSLVRTGARRDLGRTQEQTALTEPADRGHLVRETSLAALLAGGASAAGAHGTHAPAHAAPAHAAPAHAAPAHAAPAHAAPAHAAPAHAAPAAPGHAAPAAAADTTTPRDAGHAPPADPPSMWPERDRSKGHRWAMAIDLTACTGCSACVVACQVENNIPVVGRDEVRRNREMHWLRIDRYIDGEGSAARMSMMPMLCQQCAHAPCETVCPVLATVHSEEGLNQQVYNRCVGTRYCANNCPYKMRRFNWFDYAHADVLANLVLNPDVTVRERGVMEKCTFCVQRIEEGKIAASRRGTPLADGEIRTACAQSCPADAIVFGDINDPHSRVAARAASARSWRALEELNVRPSVHYATLVRNTEGDPA